MSMSAAALLEEAEQPPACVHSEVIKREIARSFSRLKMVARSLTSCRADADDLVQSTCLRAIERARLLRHDSNVAAWLIRIMHNVNVDRRRHHADRIVSGVDVTEVADKVAEPIPLWRLADEEDVQRSLSTLPSDFRSAWRLVHVEKRAHREVARMLGISTATVAGRLFRVRAALRKSLVTSDAGGDRDRLTGRLPD